MKSFIKGTLTVLVASSIASVALADSGDYGRALYEQSNINSLQSQIERLGGTPDIQERTAFSSVSEKANYLNSQEQELTLQLKDLKSQRAE